MRKMYESQPLPKGTPPSVVRLFVIYPLVTIGLAIPLMLLFWVGEGPPDIIWIYLFFSGAVLSYLFCVWGWTTFSILSPVILCLIVALLGYNEGESVTTSGKVFWTGVIFFYFYLCSFLGAVAFLLIRKPFIE